MTFYNLCDESFETDFSTNVTQTSDFTSKVNWIKLTHTEPVNRGLFYSTASELRNLNSTRRRLKLLLRQPKVAFVLSNSKTV